MEFHGGPFYLHLAMPFFFPRGMESHILAQEENEKAATPKDIQGTKVITSTATAEGSTPGAAPIALTEGPPPSVSGAAAEGPTHPPGHPNALPLSNSPRKENQFVETSGEAKQTVQIDSVCELLQTSCNFGSICKQGNENVTGPRVVCDR